MDLKQAMREAIANEEALRQARSHVEFHLDEAARLDEILHALTGLQLWHSCIRGVDYWLWRDAPGHRMSIYYTSVLDAYQALESDCIQWQE